MKRIVDILFLFCVSMALVSCGNKRLGENDDRIIFSQDTVYFGLEGGERTITANRIVYVYHAIDLSGWTEWGSNPLMHNKHCCYYTSCLEFNELTILSFDENVHINVHPSDTANRWRVVFSSSDVFNSLFIFQGER